MSRRRRARRTRRTTPQPPSRWRRLRETVDSFGGFLVIGGTIGAVVVLGVIVIALRPASPSSDELLGEAVQETAAVHVAVSSQPVGALPATGGPHGGAPLRTDVYSEPIGDGNAIHALEHGVVWISYQPDLLTDDEIDRLEDVGNDFRRDAIVAPRPQNADAVVLVSWGRRLTMPALDETLVADFIRTNRNRSPEPGIR